MGAGDGRGAWLLSDAVDILVDRPWQRDVYVPFAAIQGVRDGAIALTIPADRVDQMGWPQPPLVPELPA